MFEAGEEKFDAVAGALIEAGCIKFGDFVLKSGLRSPIYVDLRTLQSFPSQKALVLDAYEETLLGLKFDLLAGIPLAAVGFASSLSDRLMIPQITPRMDQKDHGTMAKIDGAYKAGQTAVLIDDLITTSKAKQEAAAVLEADGLKVTDVVVLIERGQGGREQLAKAAYNLHAFTKLAPLMHSYDRNRLVTPEQYAITKDYLDAEESKVNTSN